MTAAQILATNPNLSDQDLADFASFLRPEQVAPFWAQIEAHRNH
ncbi:hypothetical protein [Microtetraspora sp. AC03309]|nr:hypothetical protein [Microtetraspora sp. AC03309]